MIVYYNCVWGGVELPNVETWARCSKTKAHKEVWRRRPSMLVPRRPRPQFLMPNKVFVVLLVLSQGDALRSSTSRRALCASTVAAALCHNPTRAAAAFNFDEAIEVASAPSREWCGMVRCVREWPVSVFDTAFLKANASASHSLTVEAARFTGVKAGTPSLVKVTVRASDVSSDDGPQLLWLAEQSSGVVLAAGTTNTLTFSRVLIDEAFQDFRRVALVPRLYCKGDGLVEGKAFTLNDYAGTGRRCPGWGAPENFDQEDGVFRFRVC